MKLPRFVLAAAAAALLAGCGGMQFSKTDEGSPDRVVSGTVEIGDGTDLPAGAVVSVRVLDSAQSGYQQPDAIRGQPSAGTPAVMLPPRVLGEQKIENASGQSIPFQVAYRATDDQLRIGLGMEARVSIHGRVRYFNVSGHSLNLENAASDQKISVNPVGG